jgi:hypothetical protein
MQLAGYNLNNYTFSCLLAFLKPLYQAVNCIMGNATSLPPTSSTGRVSMKPVAAKVNLRNQQRVETALDVALTRPDGARVVTHVSNLSRAGMMIECDAQTARVLVPGNRTPAPGNWLEVAAEFSVPVVITQPVTIRADCHVVHLRRISRDCFQVGLQFIEFDGSGFSHLDAYVARLLATSH